MHKRLLLTLVCVLALSLSSFAAHKPKKKAVRADGPRQSLPAEDSWTVGVR